MASLSLVKPGPARPDMALRNSATGRKLRARTGMIFAISRWFPPEWRELLCGRRGLPCIFRETRTKVERLRVENRANGVVQSFSLYAVVGRASDDQHRKEGRAR